MQTSDRAIQPSVVIHSSQPSPALATALGDVRIRPLSEKAGSDRLKAVSLLALASALGIGSVLLGRALWQRNTEETFLPLPEDAPSTRTSVSPRDRVQVIPSNSASISPPESVAIAPVDAARQARLRQSSPIRLPRTSQGFGAAGQTPVAANPIPETAEIQEQPLAQAPPAKPKPAQETAQRSPAPETVLASLLQAPQPSTTIATTSQPSATHSSPSDQTPTPTATPPTSQPSAPVAVQPSPSAPSTSTPSIVPVPSPSSDQKPTTTAPATSSASPNSSTAITQPAQSVPSSTSTQAVTTNPSTSLQNSIKVERLQISGNTRFSERELAAEVQKTIAANPENTNADPTIIDRQLSPTELVQASEAITKFYVDRGYINSGAYVPAGILNGETPRIQVVEGKLEAINVQVKPPKFLGLAQPLSQGYVRRRLARAIGTPLNINSLVDAVKLLEQDALIKTISTELTPGTTTGGSILNVSVRQASPLQTNLSLDNGRSPSVGRFRQQGGLSYANLLGLGDRFFVNYNRSEGSRGWDLGYSIPINARNGTLSFNYSNNRGEVIEEPFRELDIKSRSQNIEIALRQPLSQSSTEEFALTLRGTHYRNRGVFLETFNDGVALPFPAQGSDPDGVTRVTALRFGQEWLKRGERDVFSLQSEFSLGINALGATRLDLPPDGRFFTWQGRGFWVHSFAPDTLLALKGQIQLANRPLVPVEQISIGGIDTVRGYRTSALLADSGWFASAEMYLPILRIPQWKSVVQIVPFFDIGQGWNKGDDEPNPNRLMSIGLGLQWKLGDTFRARLDWGTPLINANAEGGRSLRESLYFSIVFTP